MLLLVQSNDTLNNPLVHRHIQYKRSQQDDYTGQ